MAMSTHQRLSVSGSDQIHQLPGNRAQRLRPVTNRSPLQFAVFASLRRASIIRRFNPVHQFPTLENVIEHDRDRHGLARSGQAGLFVQFFKNQMRWFTIRLQTAGGRELPQILIRRKMFSAATEENTILPTCNALDPQRAHAEVELIILHREEPIRAIDHMQRRTAMTVSMHAKDMAEPAVEIRGIRSAQRVPSSINFIKDAGAALRHELTILNGNGRGPAEVDGAGMHTRMPANSLQ